MPLNPSEQEEEYFARMEFERKKKVEEEKHWVNNFFINAQ
jgi:hypothetical protein